MKTLTYSPSQNVNNGYSSRRTNEYTDVSGTYSLLRPIITSTKTKKVHVLRHWNTGEICASLCFSGWWNTNYYPLNNIPEFIKRHVDFDEVKKYKEAIDRGEYSKYPSGFFSKDGVVIKDK